MKSKKNTPHILNVGTKKATNLYRNLDNIMGLEKLPKSVA